MRDNMCNCIECTIERGGEPRDDEPHSSSEVAVDDRKLLELAAKAAGVKVVRSRLHDPLCADMLVENSARNQNQTNGPWNPLTDDGDALRLATKRKLDVEMDVNGDDIIGVSGYSVATGGFVVFEDHNDDIGAATRRCIVRAAAEIGKKMP
jgi:hypothetical protein